jgi:hypothetical protein
VISSWPIHQFLPLAVKFTSDVICTMALYHRHAGTFFCCLSSCHLQRTSLIWPLAIFCHGKYGSVFQKNSLLLYCTSLINLDFWPVCSLAPLNKILLGIPTSSIMDHNASPACDFFTTGSRCTFFLFLKICAKVFPLRLLMQSLPTLQVVGIVSACCTLLSMMQVLYHILSHLGATVAHPALYSSLYGR